MAAPSVIANVKARATRANVTPRFKNSAPELASVTIAASTAGGAGSFSPPASSAAPHQVARNTVKNTGTADSPIIENIQAIDITFSSGAQGDCILRHHTGDNGTPDCYQPHADPF